MFFRLFSISPYNSKQYRLIQFWMFLYLIVAFLDICIHLNRYNFYVYYECSICSICRTCINSTYSRTFSSSLYNNNPFQFILKYLFIIITVKLMKPSFSQNHYSTQLYQDQVSVDLITQKLKSRNLSYNKTKVGYYSKEVDKSKKNPSPEKLMKDRFTKHLKELKDQIYSIEKNSEKYGGSDHLYNELSRHKMTIQEKAEYEQKHRKKIFSLPQLTKPKNVLMNNQEKDSKRFQSRASKVSSNHTIQIASSRPKYILKNKEILERDNRVLSLQGPQQSSTLDNPKHQIVHNKWYIKPDERFKIDKKASVYDWGNNNFYLNIVKTRGLIMNDPHIPGLVKATRQKIGRDPMFCKYSNIKLNSYRKI